MLSLIISFLLAFGQAVAPLASQQTGSLEGIVTKAGTAEPLGGTRVGLASADATTATITLTTGMDGAFKFADVPVGLYRVVASRNDGYLPAEYGANRPNSRGLLIAVAPNRATKGLQIQMSQTGTITGRVLDRDGDAVARAQVVALRAAYDRNGHRVYTIAQAVITNDLGEYRMFWLPPGQYWLTAKIQDPDSRSTQAYIRPPDSVSVHQETASPVVRTRLTETGETIEEVSVPVYFPGTLDIQAARPVTLNSADNIQGMDINMPAMPVQRHIRGTVIDGMTGQPVTNGTVRAILQNTGPAVTIASGSPNAKGEFDIPGVTTGSYYVFVVPGATSGFLGGRAGRAMVQVGLKDADNISIVVPPSIRIPGKLVLQGAGTLDITRFSIQLSADPDIYGLPFPQPSVLNGLPDPNAVSHEGSFTLANVGVGDYRLYVNYQSPGTTTYLKSVRLGTTDVLLEGLHLEKQPDGELEIVIATDTAVVNGSVVTEARDPVAHGIVTLIPEARSRTDLYRSAGTDNNGRFTFKNIPPGDYKLFAWDDIERGAWLDQAYLRDYEPRGTIVHVGPGTESVSLTAIKSRRPQ